MHRLADLLRRTLRARQSAQEIIELSLIVAAVAVVGMAGLKVLGTAENGYFVPLQSSLTANPPSSPNDIVHQTNGSIVCSPTQLLPNHDVSCTIKLWDAAPTAPKPSDPVGQLQLLVNGTMRAQCPLSHDGSAGAHPFQVTCGPLIYHTQPADAGTTLHMQAYFIDGNGGHQPLNPLPETFISVVQPYNVTVACQNPWVPGPPTVQIGHPIICTANVTDQLTTAAVSNKPVYWTATAANGAPNNLGSLHGEPLFGCSAGASYVTQQQCSPLAAPGTLTISSSTPTCVTDGLGRCSMVYRHNLDDVGFGVAAGDNEAITAYVDQITGDLHDNAGTLPIQITATDQHKTGVLMACNPTAQVTFDPVNDVAQAPVPNRSIQATLPTLIGLDATGVASTTVTCSIGVYDADPNSVLDYPNCYFNTANPAQACVADNTDAHKPLGTGRIVDNNGPTNVTCTLGRNPAVSGPRPTALPAPVGAEFEYATWCHVTITVTGSPGVPYHFWGWYSGEAAGGHASSISDTVQVDFH